MEVGGNGYGGGCFVAPYMIMNSFAVILPLLRGIDCMSSSSSNSKNSNSNDLRNLCGRSCGNQSSRIKLLI